MTDLAPSVATRKAPILISLLVIILLIGLGFYFGPNLFDTTPPTLMVNGLEKDKRYRGSLTLNIAAMDEKSGMGSLTVQVDDASLTPLSLGEKDSASWTLQTTAFAEGFHTISVTATDRSLHRNQTQYALRFYIDNTPPTLDVPLETLHVGQGRTLALFLQADESLEDIWGTLFNRAIIFLASA